MLGEMFKVWKCNVCLKHKHMHCCSKFLRSVFFFLSVIQLVKNDSEDIYNVCLELSIHQRILGKNTMFFNKNINWHCLRRILIIIRNIC